MILYPHAIADENRGQAYANLIEQLLTGPKGEEPQILQANLELVECEFLWCQDYWRVIMEENKR
ncbi:MAG: hypothetical protein ACRCT1_13350 [Microcoleaceae cyanobacterium]